MFPCWQGNGQRGPFSHVREWPPLNPPRERKGLCPLTPHIAGLQLEELHALRNVSAVYMASPPKVCVLRRRHHI